MWGWLIRMLKGNAPEARTQRDGAAVQKDRTNIDAVEAAAGDVNRVIGVVFLPEKFRDIPYGWEALNLILKYAKPGSIQRASVFHGDSGPGAPRRFYVALEFQDGKDSIDLASSLETAESAILEAPGKRLVRATSLAGLNVNASFSPLVVIEGETIRDATNKVSFLGQSSDDVEKALGALGWKFRS